MKTKRIIAVALTIIAILMFRYHENLNSFFEDVVNSFSRTLIEENRYKIILIGLKSTLIISFFSILFGTIMGLIICYFRRSGTKLSKVLKLLIVFVQGTPITVLLLIFYYVIFAKVDINPFAVAILTFAIYFSAYTSEIFRGALDSVTKSQIDAAYSLGFTKYQTLIYITLPQTLSYVIPVYKNEVVSLIKLTSISGYISVMELTKSSDIIRNRTYEAFAPLIVTAILYFLICFFVGKLLDIFHKKINPRILGGINNVGN